MFLVEYSKRQNAFHVCTPEERIEANAICERNGTESSYEVIGEFEYRDDADKFIDENYDIVKNCRMYKNKEGQLFAI